MFYNLFVGYIIVRALPTPLRGGWRGEWSKLKLATGGNGRRGVWDAPFYIFRTNSVPKGLMEELNENTGLFSGQAYEGM